jgi:hypothetical protein
MAPNICPLPLAVVTNTTGSGPFRQKMKSG